MSNSRDREILRKLEMIARIKPSQESTARAMDAVREQLLGQSSSLSSPSRPKTIRPVFSRPLVKFGIAAMILIGLGLSLLYFNHDHATTKPKPGRIAKQLPQEKTPSPFQISPAPKTKEPALPSLSPAELAAELDKIDRMAADMNLPGLRETLQSPYAKLSGAAARYLGQLGGKQDINALERLATKEPVSAPASSQHPYHQALATLKQRLDPNMTSASGTTAAPLPLAAGHFTPRGCLSGLIRDRQTSKPVPDAVVELHGLVIYQTQADSNGFYSFSELVKAGTYGIAIHSVGYLGFTDPKQLPIVAIDPNTPLQRHFYLDRGCMVNVRVEDPNGRPVQDAEIHLSWLGINQQNDQGQTSLTDARGQAVVGAVKPSETAYQVTAIHSQWAPQYTTVKCTDPNVVETVKIVLASGQPLAGIATYRDGTPAKGIHMSVVPSWWHSQGLPDSVEVAADGTFVLPHMLPGTYTLMAAYATDVGFWNRREVGKIQFPWTQDVLECTVPFNSPQSQVILSGSIHWTTDQHTDQIYAMAVRLQGGIGIYAKKWVVEGNQFVMDQLTPGTYFLIIEGPNLRQTLVRNVTVPQSNLSVTLTYEPTPYLQGQVVDANTGLPIRNFTVSLQKLTDPNIPKIHLVPASRLTPVSQADGRFDILTQGPGIYRVQVIADGYLPYDVGRVDTDQQQSLFIQLVHGATLTGQVMDANGQLINEATITVSLTPPASSTEQIPWTEHVEKTTLSHQGTFTLSALPDGIHQLKVTHPGYKPLTIDQVKIQNGQNPEPLNLILEKQQNFTDH